MVGIAILAIGRTAPTMAIVPTIIQFDAVFPAVLLLEKYEFW
jgi:hypothetical protein